ncbi:cytochrome P450 [Colletotrichum musicola]|uniref:Cytochrome P450 n=1 Tax=Colletotrichum musicola TaxID=2175873 RepID=A0A8H6KS34_9PEZI|nr:cytochrome P450 [Colletotrichum musicola]
MVLLSLTVVAYVVPLSLLYFLLSTYVSRRRFQSFATARGATTPKFVPSGLPFGIGWVWRLTSAYRAGADLLDDVIEPTYKANGPTFAMAGLFGPDEIFTMDPANIQAILATQFRDFGLGERRNAQFRPLLGKNIFTAEGAFWEHSRALFRPQFSRDHINDLTETERGVQATFEALPLVGKRAETDDGGAALDVDMKPVILRFTLDTSTAFLFGESVESQLTAARGSTAGISAATAMAADVAGGEMGFAEAFHEATAWLTERSRLQGFYYLAPAAKGRKAAAYIRRYVDHYVREALSTAKPRVAGIEGYSLLDTLVEQTRDRDELRDQILGILLAGRDTTATLLAWTLIFLSRRKDIFDKLRREVVENFGEYNERETGPRIDFASLKASRYLQLVMRETLRVSNNVPVNTRIATRDTTLPRGGGSDGLAPVAVQKGQIVNFAPYVLHRREDIWGPDALEFRPDRWEGMKMDWNYVPFSGGPRICLGQQFALTEAGYFLVRLLQRFDSMEWIGPPGKPRKDLHLSMGPRDGVHVRLRYAET